MLRVDDLLTLSNPKVADRFAQQEALIAELWLDALDLKEHRKQHEREQQLLRTLIDNLPDFIYVKDTNHRFVVNNRAHLCILGVTDQQAAAGKTDADFFPFDLAARYVADEDIVLKYGTPIIDREEKTVDRHGSEAWLSTTKVPLRDGDGKIVGLIGISRDITPRKQSEAEQARLQAELRQSQKLETLGQLAGGIVHDFNNMLCAMMGYAKILKRRLSASDPQLADEAQTIIRAGETAAGITRKLLAFVRKETLQRTEINVHAMLESVTSLLRHTLDKRIVIATDARAERFTVLGDPSHLENALLNLAVNARDAMPQGGHLIFGTRTTHTDDPGAGCSPGDYLVLTVTDTGVGMDRATRDKIFEPFFTTKENGKGTGLGLSSVYVTVRNHGGWITADSEPGQGTTFTIRLPLIAPAVASSAPANPSVVRQGRGTVLVVDDEEMVRGMMCESLRGRGLAAVECRDGQEAVEYVRSHPDEIDVAAVDMIMPGMGGDEVIGAIKRIDGRIKFVVVTGASGTDSQTLMRDSRIVGIVRKPFDEESLLRIVSAAAK